MVPCLLRGGGTVIFQNEGNVRSPGELDTSVSLCNSNAPTAELLSRFWAAGRIVSYPVFTSRMPGSVLGTTH